MTAARRRRNVSHARCHMDAIRLLTGWKGQRSGDVAKPRNPNDARHTEPHPGTTRPAVRLPNSLEIHASPSSPDPASPRLSTPAAAPRSPCHARNGSARPGPAYPWASLARPLISLPCAPRSCRTPPNLGPSREIWPQCSLSNRSGLTSNSPTRSRPPISSQWRVALVEPRR